LQLETESSQRGQTITEYQSEALPLVSRNYSDLVDYVTGARPAPADATTTAVTSLTRAGSFNVNGQRSMFNDFMMDGMDNNAYGESNQGFDNQIIAPPPDSIAQFEVVTNNESAEYGRSSGGTINVATKSGGNQFHTTLYEFLRNTDLNAFGYIKPIAINAVTGTCTRFSSRSSTQSVRRQLWRTDPEEQVLLLPRLRGIPADAHAHGGRYRSHDQRAQRQLAVAVQDPWHPGTYIPAGTPFSSWPAQAQADADPTALAIAKLYLGALPGKCTVTAGLAGSGVATNDCPLNAPFTDNADKGDLRLDFQQSANSSWFLKVSDRKETGKNYNLLPEPIDMQTNGHILIHDEQIALGYTHCHGHQQGSRRAPGALRHQGRQVDVRDRHTPSPSPISPTCRISPASPAACPRWPSRAALPPSDARAPIRSGRTRPCSTPR
jgi:hypothetical protein